MSLLENRLGVVETSYWRRKDNQSILHLYIMQAAKERKETMTVTPSLNIPESLVDVWKDRVIQYHAGSDTSLKCACIVAAQVVGSYSGMTGVIAKETKRSVASVENWAHGFRLYKELRKADKNARVLWRKLPASHWWLAYDIQQAGYDAFDYLTQAYLHKWSGREMLQEWKRDREAGTAPIVFKRACVSLFGLASELEKQASRLNPAQRKAIAMVKEAFK